MTSVSQQFELLRQQQRCALIPFITAGDPNLETTAKALRILDQQGADLIELGVPYSDPLADGPVIQAAATRALAKGVKLDDVLELVRSVSPTLQAPIILFTYYNIILNRGLEAFFQAIAAAGAKGLVIPDLSLEEASLVLQTAENAGIELILLVSPNSSLERIKEIAAQSQGFIYLVSVTGVTGVRSQVDSRVEEILLQLRSVTDKPIGVGFGISQPEHAQQIQAWGADAVIVGSAFVRRLATPDPEQGLVAIATFCQELRTALSSSVPNASPLP